MAILNGKVVKAHQIEIHIQRDENGQMTAANLVFQNRLYIPELAANGVPMPELQATSVHVSQATPDQQMRLAQILSEIYESQANIGQIAGATAEAV